MEENESVQIISLTFFLDSHFVSSEFFFSFKLDKKNYVYKLLWLRKIGKKYKI